MTQTMIVLVVRFNFELAALVGVSIPEDVGCGVSTGVLLASWSVIVVLGAGTSDDVGADVSVSSWGAVEVCPGKAKGDKDSPNESQAPTNSKLNRITKW